MKIPRFTHPAAMAALAATALAGQLGQKLDVLQAVRQRDAERQPLLTATVT